jgi:RNA polymerase sigma-70 factor, ECF subfamily
VTLEKQNELFLEWVDIHGSVLWKIARLNAPLGEHQELHQDLLIALWKAVPLYRRQAKASTFIFRLAFNRALNWNRDRQAYQRRHVPLDAVAAPPDHDENRDIQEQRVADLYIAMSQLPQADRSLALMYLEDLSYREMAEVLGITENNVGVKVSRMKRRLADLLHTTRVTTGGNLP